MGRTVMNRDLEIPFVYKPCGRQETCNATVRVEGPGCYCPQGYSLNPETELCVPRSKECSVVINLREL